MSFETKLFEKYIKSLSLLNISLSIIVFFVLRYTSLIEETAGAVNIVIFLTILAVIHILFSIYSKLCDSLISIFNNNRKTNKIISNYSKLDEKQKTILDKLYFKEQETFKINTNILNLENNGYILKEQKNIGGYIYKLNPRIQRFLNQEQNKKIQEYMNNLSKNELKIIALFYEESSTNKYEHPWIDHGMQSAIYSLNNNYVIIYKSNSSILLPSSSIKIISKIIFRDKKIVRNKIVFNLNSFAPSLANGSNDRGNTSH
jgi:hypothetical protein